jgi:hypothetical protein
MMRPIVSLWPYLWRGTFASIALVAMPWPGLALLGVTAIPWPVRALCAGLSGLAGVAMVLVWRRSGWLLRLLGRVRRFYTVSDDRIILHYAPELRDAWDMPILLQRCRVELDRVAEHFGRPLGGRVVVFLFAGHREIGEILGPLYGAVALWHAHAIVIAQDSNLEETMRHEFAHLFSGRWSQCAPPLLSEGLSVWAQETQCGQAIDTAARPFLSNTALTLPALLNPRFFFAEPQRYACYMLAGSFTGFLIRRYGWEPYGRLYRLCNGFRFHAKFQKCFGVSLEDAERQWRREIILREVWKRRLQGNICF